MKSSLKSTETAHCYMYMYFNGGGSMVSKIDKRSTSVCYQQRRRTVERLRVLLSTGYSSMELFKTNAREHVISASLQSLC